MTIEVPAASSVIMTVYVHCTILSRTPPRTDDETLDLEYEHAGLPLANQSLPGPRQVLPLGPHQMWGPTTCSRKANIKDEGGAAFSMEGHGAERLVTDLSKQDSLIPPTGHSKIFA